MHNWTKTSEKSKELQQLLLSGDISMVFVISIKETCSNHVSLEIIEGLGNFQENRISILQWNYLRITDQQY